MDMRFVAGAAVCVVVLKPQHCERVGPCSRGSFVSCWSWRPVLQRHVPLFLALSPPSPSSSSLTRIHGTCGIMLIWKFCRLQSD
jgi:hypothetical protein